MSLPDPRAEFAKILAEKPVALLQVPPNVVGCFGRLDDFGQATQLGYVIDPPDSGQQFAACLFEFHLEGQGYSVSCRTQTFFATFFATFLATFLATFFATFLASLF